MNERVTTFLAVLVAAIWAGSMIFDAVNANYDPQPAIHGALMLVLGGVFGARVVGRSGEDK